MNSERSHPPTMAIWLLRHLCSKKDQEVLTGDLFERFGEGESDGWFWRQVLMAILVGIAREFRAQWPQILFATAGAPALWFWSGRFVGAILRNPLIAPAWDWGLSLQWPMSTVFGLSFQSAVAVLMVQPILAALLILNGAFRWVRLLRTLLISVPLVAATVVIWTLCSSAGLTTASAFFVPMILCILLVSAWVGCRTAPGATISGDKVFLATRMIVTCLVVSYLLQAMSGMGDGSWWALDQLNRPLARTYTNWRIWSRWIMPLEVLIISAGCGWIAGRLNRKYHVMVPAILLVSWMVLFGYPIFSYWSKIVADSINHPWFRAYLVEHMAGFFSAIAGTLLGGLLSARDSRESPPVTNAGNPLATS